MLPLRAPAFLGRRGLPHWDPGQPRRGHQKGASKKKKKKKPTLIRFRPATCQDNSQHLKGFYNMEHQTEP